MEKTHLIIQAALALDHFNVFMRRFDKNKGAFSSGFQKFHFAFRKIEFKEDEIVIKLDTV